MLKSGHVFQQKHIMAERSVLMKNIKHPFLVGLHFSFQTTDKLYFVLDYVNGGEVSSSLPCEVRDQSFSLLVLMTCCFFLFLLSSCSIISRGRGSSWSPEPGSTLLK